MAFGFSYTLFDIDFIPLESIGYCCCCRWLLINERDCTLLNIFCLIRLFRVHTLSIMLSHFTPLRVFVSCCRRYFHVSFPFHSISWINFHSKLSALLLFFSRLIFNCFISTPLFLLLFALLSNYKALKLAVAEEAGWKTHHITDIEWINGEKWWWAIEYQLECWVDGCHCYTSRRCAEQHTCECVCTQSTPEH